MYEWFFITVMEWSKACTDIEFNMFSMLKPSDNRICSKRHDALNLAKLFQATLIFF